MSMRAAISSPGPVRAPVTRCALPRRAFALIATVVLLLVAGDVAAPAPADAADRGVGFGTWAPVSAYGWHGSMLVGGVHTYCITPGAPAPTGQSVDHGVSGSAAGLAPRQLAAINHLVTAYGQTNDPVQAAAVAWAVKATANRSETLHAFGYPGESLAGAIHWTMSALAPQHDRAVQERAVVYYDEASRIAAGAVTASGALTFTTDAADHRSGTVRVDTTSPATGTLTLTDAVFADSGSPVLEGATGGSTYAIRAAPPAEGRPYVVTGAGRFDAGIAAAVRHYTTPGGQETAGPAGRLQFDVAGADATPRVPPFAPAIATRVAEPNADGGPYVDDVTFASSEGDWPRADDGSFLPVVASAVVYRTADEPVVGSAVPAGAEVVGGLQITTDAATGPTLPYTVTSDWLMSTPGYYTAVWSIRGAEQSPAVAAHTGPDYAWAERFGEPSQIVVVAPPPPTPTPAATPTPTPAPAVPTPAPTETTPAPAAASPPAHRAVLAATGTDRSGLRLPLAVAIGLLSLGLSLVASRRAWLGAPARIG